MSPSLVYLFSTASLSQPSSRNYNIINDVDSILSGKSFKRKHDSDKSFSSDTPTLNDDDSIIKTLVDKKRPTVQCEECYECFEDQEKLAWHSLNDH